MAMIDAEGYLRALQREGFNRYQRLEIANLSSDPFFDPSDPWRNLASAILRDAMQLIPTNDLPKLKRIAVGYLPIGTINACCINSTLTNCLAARLWAMTGAGTRLTLAFR